MNILDAAEIIKQEVRRCWHVGAEFHGWTHKHPVKIDYSLRGTRAGLACGDHQLIFNLMLLADQDERGILQTSAHETAHIVVHHAWMRKHNIGKGLSCTELEAAMDDAPQAHGYEWRRMMHLFGYLPQRCHSFDVTRFRVRHRRKQA